MVCHPNNLFEIGSGPRNVERVDVLLQQVDERDLVDEAGLGEGDDQCEWKRPFSVVGEEQGRFGDDTAQAPEECRDAVNGDARHEIERPDECGGGERRRD